MTGALCDDKEEIMELAEILKAVKVAADGIATLEPSLWDGPVVYFLTILDARLEVREVGLGKAILKKVAVHISNRIELDRWV